LNDKEYKRKKLNFHLFEKIGRLSSNGIFMCGIENETILYANEVLAEILEIDSAKNNISIALIRDAILDNDEYLGQWYEELRTSGTISDLELRVKAQKPKFILLDAYLLREEDVVIGFVKDVTNAKEHSTYITDFGARKDTILDMVAHNLSGPLNVTTNLLNMIDQQNQSEQYRKIDRHTRMIRENTHQCIEIINSFLKEEHLESPNIFAKPTRFDVITKIKVIISRMRVFHQQKNVVVNTSSHELFVLGDDVKFFQVIHNLLSNALKYSEPGTTINISVEDLTGFFRVSVRDEGIGIPEHLHPYLFMKNTPASRKGLQGEESIGMGLYVVKKLVTMMKGEVFFESEEGKGTTFTVQLPKG
jgi:two-component system, OmpR family, sensor histidine kinase VicK